MIALARIESGRLTPRRRHAPREEYFAWVGRVLPNPAGASMRRWFYNRFVTRWPDLDAWFAEPFSSGWISMDGVSARSASGSARPMRQAPI